MVVKAGEDVFVRCRVLNGSKGSFPQLFTLSSIPFYIGTDILDFFPSCFYTILTFSSEETLDWPRTESSSAVSQCYFVLALQCLGHNLPRLGPLGPNE